jgi:hypothetical protein
VPAERQIALDVIGQRQYEPHGRGKVSLEPLAWDKPGPGTVMRATMTPQEAIDRGLAPPAGCDVVIVIFWARMGTRLPDPRYREANGEPYYSGAEWEFENAMEALQRLRFSSCEGRPFFLALASSPERARLFSGEAKAC